MKNVVLAVIGSKGQVSISFAASLNRTAALAKEKDVYIHFDYIEELTSGMSTMLQKNLLANKVLSSNTADGLFFINPNLSWVPEDFFSLVGYEGDGVISGAYVDSFQMAESYAIALSEDNDERNTLSKADFFSMGFVYIPKKVLQGLTQFVDQIGAEDDPDKFYLFFKEIVKNNLIFQEDNYFCDIVKNSGFELLVDSRINCTNHQAMHLRTNYQDYLQKAWAEKLGEENAQDMTQN
jgi:hypothetical protein